MFTCAIQYFPRPPRPGPGTGNTGRATGRCGGAPGASGARLGNVHTALQVHCAICRAMRVVFSGIYYLAKPVGLLITNAILWLSGWKFCWELRSSPTVHCTLYTVHCTLYTVHSTVFFTFRLTVDCTTVHTAVHCTRYTVYCKLYTVQCTQ